ncbi:MAG: tetratricopeptide repeat protein [Gemmataceae bacterium]
MSDVLCLVNHLLQRARRLANSSQFVPAIELLRDVVTFPLSAARAEEVHRLLGELYLKLRRYRKAAKQFRQAIRLAPRTARSYYLLGRCVASHPSGRPDRALNYYRRALRLSPQMQNCRAEAGLLAVRLGQVGYGLRLLRQAAQDQPRLLAKLVRGYCEAGRPAQAQRTLQLARFAAPRCPRLRQLQVDLQLGRLRGQQARRMARSATAPVVLPFLYLRHVD